MLNFQEFTKQQINEIGDQPYPVNLVKVTSKKYESSSRMSDNRRLDISFCTSITYHDYGEWTLAFKVNDKIDITGGGDAYRILSSVIIAIEQFVKICDEPFIKLVFVAAYKFKDEIPHYQKTSRADLYRAMLKKYARRGKFEFSEETDGENSIFTLYKKESSNA